MNHNPFKKGNNPGESYEIEVRGLEKIDEKFEGIEEQLGGMFKETGDKLEANINEMNTSTQGLNTAMGELRGYVCRNFRSKVVI